MNAVETQQLFRIYGDGRAVALQGLTTAPVMREVSHRLGIEMPITEGVCTVLDGVPLSDLVGTLMQREPTSE